MQHQDGETTRSLSHEVDKARWPVSVEVILWLCLVPLCLGVETD
jgi:hypothetical protein